jgi:hypothetical protein
VKLLNGKGKRLARVIATLRKGEHCKWFAGAVIVD